MNLKIAIAQINPTVGDLDGNRQIIYAACQLAARQNAHIVVTPELSLVGYSPEDLLLRAAFIEDTAQALVDLAADLASFTHLHVLVGYPLLEGGRLFNAVSVLVNGRILGTYCKYALPNNTVFDEKRYFSSRDQPFVFTLFGFTTRWGINLCEDAWNSHAPARARAAGAEVLLVPNASPFHLKKQDYRYQQMRNHVCAQGMSLVYANLVGGQDELIFDGNSFVMDATGKLIAQLPHAQEALQVIPFEGAQPSASLPAQPPQVCEAQVYAALMLGLRDYVRKNNFPSVLMGLSGGVDSALVLALAVDALGAHQVRAVMMPSLYTADISQQDAYTMAKGLGVRYDEIPISSCFNVFRRALAESFAGFVEDTTEENIQARIRGTLIMALSNKTGALVLTTGNKSELAVGYCTLYGDMAGGFAVIKDVTKTWVYRLCAWRNARDTIPMIPQRILTRAPSAELRAHQTDQDHLPPYAVLDAIIQKVMEENASVQDIIAAGFSCEDVLKITRLIKMNEYKRRQAPIGCRVTPRAFGRDWRYPVTVF